VTRDPDPANESEPELGSGAVAKQLFPAGLADGRSFVNRETEYQRLMDDIVAGRNAWFDCPPRYGVSTLIERARKDLRPWREPRITSSDCRLNAVHDSRSFCDAMLECVGQLASQVIGRPNVMEEKVARLFAGVDKDIYLDEKHLQTISFDAGDDPLATLNSVARELETLAAESGCRTVFIVHDMQQLFALRQQETILNMIRNMIEFSPSATWLVHGNNHNAMQRLFQTGEAPLQGCCRRFSLRPINASVYSQYLADAAQTRWRCYIGRKATAMILTLTDRHPLWFNELCRRLWSSDLPPVIQDVVNEWGDLVRQNRHITSREMERLSPNQRAVLRCLAQTPTDQPRAKAFVRRTRVSSASVGQAVRILEEQDLIKADPDGRWMVSDPVMQWSLHPRTDIVDEIYEVGTDIRW